MVVEGATLQWSGISPNAFALPQQGVRMARVPLLSKEDLPESYRYLFTDSAVGEATIFRAMAHAPEQMQSYMRYSTTLWRTLPDRERELAILAVARAIEARYEWHQHVRLGREAGVTTAEIRAIGADALAELNPPDRTLVTYAQAVALDRVTDADHDAIRSVYDEETVVGLALLASHYVATARTLAALGIEPEEPFVGWEPD